MPRQFQPPMEYTLSFITCFYFSQYFPFWSRIIIPLFLKTTSLYTEMKLLVFHLWGDLMETNTFSQVSGTYEGMGLGWSLHTPTKSSEDLDAGWEAPGWGRDAVWGPSNFRQRNRPCNMHAVTSESWPKWSTFLRLHHFSATCVIFAPPVYQSSDSIFYVTFFFFRSA